MLKLLISFALLLPLQAFANDTMAELKTGGLTFVRTPDVSMEEEKLFISPDLVTVNYVFRNNSDKDVSGLVAFPMPDLESAGEGDIAINNLESDNFLGFSVKQDGRDIKTNLQQIAFAAGIDVTDDIVAAGVPLLPFSEVTAAAVSKLPAETIKDWMERGLVQVESYDQGEGMKDHIKPVWLLRSAYWWKTTFPAGQTVEVEHRYTPSVGGTVSVSFLDWQGDKGERFEEYKTRYCMDDDFVRTAQKAVKNGAEGQPQFTESWISYILTTGANWGGAIKKFTLTVDKGDAKNFISFCGEGVRKTGPTTFEMRAEDFYPVKDLDVLILRANGQ